ncbi:MAG: hypothetical protein R3301_11520 [Saprospiraceae bacterium]|nr:hypothetical protein [Saprospiraceae bacterium]
MGIVFVLALSLASYVYLDSVEPRFDGEDPVLVEELKEDRGELLPDVQLIKALMQRTLDFMSTNRPF